MSGGNYARTSPIIGGEALRRPGPDLS